MRNKTTIKLVALLALLSFAAPSDARPDDHRYNKHVSKQYRKAVKRRYKNRKRVARQAAKWDWNRHNWNEQRAYMQNNWRARSAQLDARRRAELDAQLRAQWLSYNNNNYNGPYNWDMYNNPRFFDYIHNNNPSLLNTIRNVFNW